MHSAKIYTIDKAPAAISAQPSPCRHLCAGVAAQAPVQAPPSRHLHAGNSTQAPPRKYLRANTSGLASPCKHVLTNTSMQDAPRKQIPACTSVKRQAVILRTMRASVGLLTRVLVGSRPEAMRKSCQHNPSSPHET